MLSALPLITLDDYTDLNKLDAQYVEAAGVLTGLGIVNGIDAVTLDPDGYYTREQAAKIMAYMLWARPPLRPWT